MQIQSMTQIRKAVKTAKKSGISLNSIGVTFGICAAEVKRILRKGYYPGPKVAARLGLPVKCPACKRRAPKPVIRTYRRISDLSPADLLWVLEHRETVNMVDANLQVTGGCVNE
jgi:hypothetical protein